MNSSNHAVRRGITCVVLLILAGMMPSSLFAQDPLIDVEVVAGIEDDKINFKNSECPSRPHDMGCVNTAKGSKNWIMWDMSNESNGQGWQLTALRLKIEELSDSIRQCAVKDFNLDPQTGYANDFRVDGNNGSGRVRNENDCDEAYEVAYELYARNSNTGDDADSDPIIRNGGRN